MTVETKIWGVEASRRIGPHDSDQAMRLAYTEALREISRGILEGNPMLRILEVSLDIDLGRATIRIKGYENDEVFRQVYGRRNEVQGSSVGGRAIQGNGSALSARPEISGENSPGV